MNAVFGNENVHIGFRQQTGKLLLGGQMHSTPLAPSFEEGRLAGGVRRGIRIFERFQGIQPGTPPALRAPPSNEGGKGVVPIECTNINLPVF